MRIDVVVDVKTTLGEGPLWDVDQQRLYWIDSFDGRVFRATADGREIRAWDVPAKIGSIAIRKDGNGAICSLAGLAVQRVKKWQARPAVRRPTPEDQPERERRNRVPSRHRAAEPQAAMARVERLLRVVGIRRRPRHRVQRDPRGRGRHRRQPAVQVPGQRPGRDPPRPGHLEHERQPAAAHALGRRRDDEAPRAGSERPRQRRLAPAPKPAPVPVR